MAEETGTQGGFFSKLFETDDTTTASGIAAGLRTLNDLQKRQSADRITQFEAGAGAFGKQDTLANAQKGTLGLDALANLQEQLFVGKKQKERDRIQKALAEFLAKEGSLKSVPQQVTGREFEDSEGGEFGELESFGNRAKSRNTRTSGI